VKLDLTEWNECIKINKTKKFNLLLMFTWYPTLMLYIMKVMNPDFDIENLLKWLVESQKEQILVIFTPRIVCHENYIYKNTHHNKRQYFYHLQKHALSIRLRGKKCYTNRLIKRYRCLILDTQDSFEYLEVHVEVLVLKKFCFIHT